MLIPTGSFLGFEDRTTQPNNVSAHEGELTFLKDKEYFGWEKWKIND